MRVLFFLLMFVPLTAAAQGDLEAERTSLKGIPAFAVGITLEGPQHLVESDVLRSDVLLHRILNRLNRAGLSVERVTPGAPGSTPHLHIHLNMLELDGGIVPFAISADFYQDVRLATARREMSAVTWDESVLGLVSQDLLQTIPESVDGLVDQFVDDYLAANQR